MIDEFFHTLSLSKLGGVSYPKIIFLFLFFFGFQCCAKKPIKSKINLINASYQSLIRLFLLLLIFFIKKIISYIKLGLLKKPWAKMFENREQMNHTQYCSFVLTSLCTMFMCSPHQYHSPPTKQKILQSCDDRTLITVTAPPLFKLVDTFEALIYSWSSYLMMMLSTGAYKGFSRTVPFVKHTHGRCTKVAWSAF